MTQEDKELLLKDLCARLQYGVKCYSVITNGKPNTIGGYRKVLDDFYVEVVGRWVPISTIKPYLRPMSSMTEDERKYIEDKCAFTTIGPIGDRFCLAMPVVATEWLIDFYNSHHLDWRGLIPMGLALEAPDGMYNLNKE